MPATNNLPRLRVSHLLVFTFAVGLVLGLESITVRSLGMSYPELIGQAGARYVPIMVFQAVVYGGAVCGLLALAARRYKGIPFPTHPAEYLWILLGISVIVSLSLPAVGAHFLGPIFYWIGLPVFSLAAAWLSRSSPWRWFYALMAFSHYIALPFAVLFDVVFASSFTYAISLGVLGHLLRSLVLAAFVVRGRPLTWPGWAGVICQFGMTAVAIGYYLLNVLSA